MAAEKINKPDYDTRSVYFTDKAIPERIDRFAETLPDCNLSKVVANVMEKAIDALEKKDFLKIRTHQIVIEVTL